MKKALLIFITLFLCSDILNAQNKETHNLDLQVSIYPEEGWMNGGYGSLLFKFKNNSDAEIKTGQVTGEWFVAGQQYNKWNWEPNLNIPAGTEKEGRLISWMPPKTEKLAQKGTPQVKGTAIVILDNDEVELPFSVDIPVAKLSTPLVSKKGKYIELILQEKTWAGVTNPKKVTRYIDDAYKVMFELTGNRPYEAALMALKESPRNPYFAYAGNPIILNCAYVQKSVANFDNDEVDFGWIHEMGHDFDDVIGHYYNYGTFTEFQANIKLSYVLEELCTKHSSLKIKSWVDKKTLLTGTAFNDEYFAPAGDKYLADKSRSWETLSSDEYHALFHSVIRKHGWKVMKKYYKSFRNLSASGINPPKGKERIFLSLAVLDNCCKEDLMPLFKTWRFPIKKDGIKRLSEKYKLTML